MNKSAKALSLGLVLSQFLVLLSSSPTLAITVRVDQSGYHPNAPKQILVEGVPFEGGKPLKATLWDPNGKAPFAMKKGRTVFEAPLESAASLSVANPVGPGLNPTVFDFSDFKTPGLYELRVEGLPPETANPTIQVNDAVYWDTLRQVVRGFYLVRSRYLEDGQLLKPDSRMDSADDTHFYDVTGRWHPGTDYSQYVSATSTALAKLLAMVAWNPKPYKYLSLDYPTTEPVTDHLPDLMHEMKVWLSWLLTMQRPDGGFYLKVGQLPERGSQLRDDLFHLSDLERRLKYVYQISPNDSAIAAATLAMATQRYRQMDLSLAVKSLRAAERAWDYIDALNPSEEAGLKSVPTPETAMTGFQPNSASDIPLPKVDSVEDESAYRLWAATELYMATGKERYHQYVLNHTPSLLSYREFWRHPAFQGLVDYAFPLSSTSEEVQPRNKALVETIQNSVRRATAAHQETFSNAILLEKPASKGLSPEFMDRLTLLLYAYRLNQEPQFLTRAVQGTRVLFGMNNAGLSYVTGMGSHWPSLGCHRGLYQNKAEIKGLLLIQPAREKSLSSLSNWTKGLDVLRYSDETDPCRATLTSIGANANLAFVLGVLNSVYNTQPSVAKPVSSPLIPQTQIY